MQTFPTIECKRISGFTWFPFNIRGSLNKFRDFFFVWALLLKAHT